MILKGTFSEYPFAWLLEIFLHKRETGLLEITSPQQSGYFYIKDGELKDGELGNLRGAGALELVGTLEDASFQFQRLDPSDYARVVWEKSFGPSNVTAGIGSFEAVRRTLKQFLSYPLVAYDILERAVVWLAWQALPQLLLYTRTTYHTLKNAGTFITRRVYAAARYVDLSRRARSRRKPVLAIRPAKAEWQGALLRTSEVTFKKARSLNFQRGFGLIQERTAAFSSPQPTPPRATQKLVPAALRNLDSAGIRIARRMRTYATTLSELSKKIEVRRQLVVAFHGAQAEWQIASRHTNRLISKTASGALNLQMALALIRDRAATFRLFQTSAPVRTVQRAPFYSSAGHNPENTRISIARRTRAWATAALEFARGVQVRRNLVPILRPLLEVDFRIGLRRTKQKILSSGRTPNLQKAIALFQEQRAQGNISFAVIVVVLLVASTVSISKLLSTNNQLNDASVTKEGNIGAQTEAQPKRVSTKRRTKRKSPISRTRTRKQAASDPSTVVAK